MAHPASSNALPTAPPPGVQPRIIELPVRFSDIDGMGHVNNVVYLTYTEEARSQWANKDLGVESLEKFSFILAHAAIDFLAPVDFGADVRVAMWVPRIGGKSWDFGYAISDVHSGALYATARTTQVAYDYKTRSTVSIPKPWLAHLQKLAPKSS